MDSAMLISDYQSSDVRCKEKSHSAFASSTPDPWQWKEITITGFCGQSWAEFHSHFSPVPYCIGNGSLPITSLHYLNRNA